MPTAVNNERKISLEKIREYEVKLIAPLMPLGSKILEIGAGAGWQSKILSEYGFAVEAIDVEGSRYEGQRIWPVVNYDGTNIPFPDAYFDVVFTSNVLEHVKHVEQFLCEIKRVLKPRGIAVHAVPSGSWRLWSILVTFVNAWKQLLIALLSEFRHRYILSDITQERATAYKQNRIRFLRQTIYPPPAHGEVGNCLSEIYLFSRHRWTSLFRKKGWSIRSYYPNRLFYSGGTCLTFMGIKVRHIMSYILGSSCHIYLLEPQRK